MELDQLLSSVSHLKFDQEALYSLDLLASTPEGAHRFVNALVKCQEPLTDCAAVSHSMEMLEALADEAEVTACVFMSHLWSVANALQMHDICDAIDIWLSNCKSAELSRHLLVLAASQNDAGLRRHYEQMAK